MIKTLLSEAVIFFPCRSLGCVCLLRVFFPRQTSENLFDSRDVTTMNRCSDRGAHGSDFRTSIPEHYFGDGHLFGPDSFRKIGNGDPSSSHKMLVNVDRGIDCAPTACHGFGNNQKYDRKAYLSGVRDTCDCGHVCDGVGKKTDMSLLTLGYF